MARELHIGERRQNNDGYWMTVIKWRNSRDMDFQFDDGKIVQHRTYWHFCCGCVRHPDTPLGTKPRTDRVGETVVNKQGVTLEIIRYAHKRDIDILVRENGHILKHRNYETFHKGTITDPALPKPLHKEWEKQRIERVGETCINKAGKKCTIIEYKNWFEVTVQSEDGITAQTTYQRFREGGVCNDGFRRSNKEDYIGKQNVNQDGKSMTIKAYRNCSDIDVEFEDGAVVKSTLANFRNGKVRHPDYFKQGWIGKTAYNNQGRLMKIIDYDHQNIVVEFEDGVTKSSQLHYFKSGGIMHPADKTKLGQIYTHKATGMKMKVIAYRKYNDIDVEFDDGTIVTTTSSPLTNGTVLYPKNYVGQSKPNKYGQTVTIIAYRGCKDIDVEFDDGEKAYHKYLTTFYRGDLVSSLKSAEMRAKRQQDRAKECEQHEVMSQYGLKMWVKEYRCCDDVDIEFETGYINKHKQHKRFLKGQQIGHPFPYQVGDMIMLKPAYTLHTEGDFYCKCPKCGLSDVMTVEEMRQHKCPS